jgi:hypothetical protein
VQYFYIQPNEVQTDSDSEINFYHKMVDGDEDINLDEFLAKRMKKDSFL